MIKQIEIMYIPYNLYEMNENKNNLTEIGKIKMINYGKK